MEKKRLAINLISNMFSFVLQIGISFLITPVIVEKVGDAAYGFIGLANNFVSYASVFSIIINSMASRFITLELSKGNQEKANRYYSSVFILDLLVSIIIAIASVVIVCNLNKLLNIPDYLNLDVKLTFILVFANFIISILGTVFSVASFAKNRLDIAASKNIIGNVLKTICLILLFTFCKPKIYYIAIASILFSGYLLIANMNITKNIAPELKIKRILFDKLAIKELISSGVWNALNSLGKILLTGLDLLVANIFVGADGMGVLAIAKTVPNAIESLLATISNTFTPQFIMLYSKEKTQELIESVNLSIKILGLIMIVPLAGFIAFGTDFFALWLPSKTIIEIHEIQILSVLSLLPYIISANNFTLGTLDTTTNKLKRPVIATLIISVLSVITTVIVLQTTNLGVFAIAGVSSIYWSLKVFFFNTINAAKNLELKWNIFFKQYLDNIGCFAAIVAMFIIIEKYTVINTWKKMIIISFFVGMAAYLLVYEILLNKKEKAKVNELVQNKFLRKG